MCENSDHITTNRDLRPRESTRQETITPVVTIIFTWNSCRLARFWSVKIMITTGSDCESTEWINMYNPKLWVNHTGQISLNQTGDIGDPLGLDQWPYDSPNMVEACLRPSMSLFLSRHLFIWKLWTLTQLRASSNNLSCSSKFMVTFLLNNSSQNSSLH